MAITGFGHSTFYTVPPGPLVGWGGGYPSPFPAPLFTLSSIFAVSVSLIIHELVSRVVNFPES